MAFSFQKPILRAGELRNQILLVQPTLAQDSSGAWKIDAVNLVATLPAAVYDLSGRELYAAQQRVAEVTHVILIRYMDGVKAKMNVWFGTREFQILAIQNPDNQKPYFLMLLCLERDDSAREAGGGSAGAGTTVLSGGLPAGVVFTATAGQTLFNLPGTPIGAVYVYWNGLLMVSPDDYSISGSQLTMVVPVPAGERILAIYQH